MSGVVFDPNVFNFMVFQSGVPGPPSAPGGLVQRRVRLPPIQIIRLLKEYLEIKTKRR